MRLIDADRLRKDINDYPYGYRGMINDTISRQPTVDAVEVVRCKDCRWGKEVCGNIECFADLNAPTEYHGYEWYCPIGERGFEDEIG